MGILQKHPGGSIALLGLIVAGLIIWTVMSAHSAPPTNVDVSTHAWFSSDDGKTTFKDDQNKIPPFDHNGQPACRAHVFTCDNGKTTFVQFLERYTPDAQKRLQEIRSSKQPPEMSDIQRIMTTGVEVKRPGDGEWVNASDPRATKIKKPVCANNPSAHPQPVLP